MRKLLPLVVVVLAFLASSSAFAADAPSAPMSQEDFLAALESSSPDAGGAELPELEGVPEPIFMHGNCILTNYVCIRCADPSKLNNCEQWTCNYNGTIHTHNINCTGCRTFCPA